MSLWREGTGWRYEFQVKKERYSKQGFPTKAAARAAMEAHRQEIKTPQAPTPTGMDFLGAANEYLDYCKRRYSEKNYKEKAYIYRSFRDFIGNLPLAEITARTILSYLATRKTNPNFNKHRKSLCALMQWCFKHGFLPINPCIYVDTMPESPARKSIPTQEEVIKMFLVSGDLRPFLLALYALAARLGEINNLRWDAINFERSIVILWTRKGDGSYRAQPKPLNDELYEELRRLYGKRSGEWVFPNPETGLPYKNRRKQIRNICKAAGIPPYGWHSIRHHVASLLADHHKVSLPTIQRMLGHANLSTTQIYIQSLGDGVREAGDLLKFEKAPVKPRGFKEEGTTD